MDNNIELVLTGGTVDVERYIFRIKSMYATVNQLGESRFGFSLPFIEEYIPAYNNREGGFLYVYVNGKRVFESAGGVSDIQYYDPTTEKSIFINLSLDKQMNYSVGALNRSITFNYYYRFYYTDPVELNVVVGADLGGYYIDFNDIEVGHLVSVGGTYPKLHAIIDSINVTERSFHAVGSNDKLLPVSDTANIWVDDVHYLQSSGSGNLNYTSFDFNKTQSESEYVHDIDGQVTKVTESPTIKVYAVGFIKINPYEYITFSGRKMQILYYNVSLDSHGFEYEFIIYKEIFSQHCYPSPTRFPSETYYPCTGA